MTSTQAAVSTSGGVVAGVHALPHRVARATAPARRVIGRTMYTAFAPLQRVVAPAGWIVLGLAVLALALAAVFGWAEFAFLGWVLVAAIVVALVFLVGRASYGVFIELNPRRVVVGDRAMGRMVVTNSGPRKLPPNRMELPVGAGVAEFQLPPMAPGHEQEELFQVPTNRRAVIVAGPARSVRGDQLGLLRRSLQWSEAVELFVHPRTVRLHASAAGLVRDLEGQVSNRITNNDLAFHALRPYVPGDDRRYVHWRTSARVGQLMVRQFQETRRSQIVLAISTRRDAYASEDEFELAVSIAASIATQVILDGTQLAVVSEQGIWRTTTVTSMLDASSRLVYGDERGFSGFRSFVRDHTKRMPAPSVLVAVGGATTEVAEFRSLHTLYGPDTQHLSLRADAGAQSRLGRLGGTSMLTVGSLDDLAGMLKGVAA
jgi:hypothetical protein